MFFTSFSFGANNPTEKFSFKTYTNFFHFVRAQRNFQKIPQNFHLPLSPRCSSSGIFPAPCRIITIVARVRGHVSSYVNPFATCRTVCFLHPQTLLSPDGGGDASSQPPVFADYFVRSVVLSASESEI